MKRGREGVMIVVRGLVAITVIIAVGMVRIGLALGKGVTVTVGLHRWRGGPGETNHHRGERGLTRIIDRQRDHDLLNRGDIVIDVIIADED